MTRPKHRLLPLALFFVAGLLLAAVPDQTSQNHTVIELTIEGVIGPATDDYVQRALDTASKQATELVVIRMDTPGGLDTAMRGIIKNIISSPIPVAVYVAPSGARAASAGTYILFASHIAAMAPGTNLGAATPVQLGGISPPAPKQKPKDSEDKPAVDANGDAMKRKVINDAAAYIRGLAQMRGRNEEWAEKAVREAASLPASEALTRKVIDIVAVNMADLLKQINGREVEVRGHKRTINTKGLMVTQLEPDWRSQLLAVITNPNVAYILMLIGIYGLIFELSNPGAVFPGTIGAISLLLALYSFQLLPINYAGMALILLGISLMLAEAFQPSFGILGIGGVISFVMGSIILMDTEAPGYGIDIAIIITFALISALIFIFIIGMAIKSRHRPIVSGIEQLMGAYATVINDFDNEGSVNIHSETWNAQTHTPVYKGQQVRVTAVNGLVLQVEPVPASTEEIE